MPSSYLALNFQTGSTPQVKRYNGLSVTAVGTAFGTAEAPITTSQPLNRVIQFGSQNTFLALVSYKIWRSTDAGVNWTNTYSLASPSATAGQCSGLNVVYSNGIPRVCMIWAVSGDVTVTGAYSTDGINWTQDGTVAKPAGVTGFIKDTIYRNTLYSISNAAGAGGVTVAYTPGTTPTTIASPEYGQSMSLCVFNDTLVMTGANGSITWRYLYSLAAGTWQSRVQIINGNYAGTGKSGMFVDSASGELIIFIRYLMPGAWLCYRVSSSFVPVNISATVLPYAMLSSASGTARVLTFVDGEAAPGSNPDKYIIYADGETAGTLPALYKWVSIAEQMVDIDSGGNIRDALTLSNNCQGVGYWTSGENAIELINRAPVSGGVILSYKAYGGGSVNIRAWYGTQFEEYETHAATLVGTTAITADGSTRQVTWDNATDGVAAGARVRLIMEVYA